MQDGTTAEERRGLLKNILYGALALAALPLPWLGWKFLKPQVQRRKLAPLDIGAAADFSAGSYRRISYGDRPVGILRSAAGELRAFDLRCTHANCIVNWNRESEFVCPCHGGRFDAEGRVNLLPPEKPLLRLDIAEREGRVILRDEEYSTAADQI